MNYLARKISRAKWDPTPHTGDDIRADAITGCLRTTDDILSLWRCHHDKSDIAEVALALTSGPKVDKIDPIHIVLIHQDILQTNQIHFENTPNDAETAIADLKVRHVDAKHLTMSKLFILATEIARNFRSNSAWYWFTSKQVREILLRAVNDGRLNLENLHEKLQAKLKAE